MSKREEHAAAVKRTHETWMLVCKIAAFKSDEVDDDKIAEILSKARRITNLQPKE